MFLVGVGGGLSVPHGRMESDRWESQVGRVTYISAQGGPKIALRGGGGGWHGRPAKEGGGAFQKWASVPGPLFCVRTDVATKGAGTQILARKFFFTKKFSPTYV